MKKSILTWAFMMIILSISILCQGQNKVEPAFDILAEYPRVRDFTLSSGGDEAYFTMQSFAGDVSVIFGIKKQNNTWSEPEPLPFSGKYKDLEPFLSPDGLRLYYASNRPLTSDQDKPKDFDLWYSERTSQDKPWQQPINMGSPINTEHDEYYPCLTNNNNLYFTSTGHGSIGEDDIFISQWQSGQYQTPVSLPESINTAGAEYNAYISPDEDFIIFGAFKRADAVGGGDLYISFRDENLQWQPAKILSADINSPSMDYSPFVDLKNSILYFTSNRRTISTTPIETLEQFTNEVNKHENGLLKLYKISIEEILEQ